MSSWIKKLLLLPNALLVATLVHANLLVTRDTTVAPYYFPSDQNWDGIDGYWSSFTIQIGTPAQTVRVFFSTQSYQTWAIIPYGCLGAADASACASVRGGLYTSNSSTTWTQQGLYDTGIEENLGYESNAIFGFDTVTTAGNGENGLTVKNTTVGGVAGTDFYLGLFGVNPKPTNFTDFNNPFPSFMTQLKDNKQIPSLSFGYTAGAKYRFSGVYASLTLGGYDTAAYTANNVTFNFNSDNDHELVVALQSITTPSTIASSPNAVQLLPNPIYIEIDSTVPQIWLPTEACAAFEKEFGLVYNDTYQLYTLNSTLRNTLLARNANVTFTVGQLTSGGETLQIVLPYSAFDQIAKAPYAGLGNDTYYFPLKRGQNSTQYILGRTFLQEAYLIVDYEVARFQLGQTVWDSNASQKLVAIPPANQSQDSSSWTSSTYKPTYSNDSSTSSNSSSSKLSGGAIAGIVIGAIILIALVAFGVFACSRYRRRKALAAKADDMSENKDTNVYPKAELMGSAPSTFGMTHHDLDRKGLLSAYPPSSDDTAYSPSSSGFPYTPGGEGTLSSMHSSNHPGIPAGVVSEAHSRAIYEMPGDMPNTEKDGRQFTEKEALQHRERIYNGIDEAMEQSGSDTASPVSAFPRENRRVAPEEVVNAQTRDSLGRHRAFSFEFDSSERQNLTDSSGSTLIQTPSDGGAEPTLGSPVHAAAHDDSQHRDDSLI